MRRWVVAGVCLLGLVGLGLVVLDLGEEPEPKFCTLALSVAPTPVPLPDGRYLVLEDQGSPGPDGCETATDGSNVDPVVRGDDCTVVYPDHWEADRPVESIAPTAADGTCWRADP
jgi:hypothetical protein